MIVITPQLLAAALPSCPPQRAELFAPHLQAACDHYGINATPERLAAFLAQVGVESGSLLYTAELWGPTPQQTRYEGRADLGNTQPGDGPRFRGRGLIQTTGRYNHQRVRDRLRAVLGPRVPDFEQAPQSLEQPLWASWSAADYWDWKGLNAVADAGNFERITRLVNGGLTHHDRRVAIFNQALPMVRAAAASEPPTAATAPAAAPEAPRVQPASIDIIYVNPQAPTAPQPEHTMAPLLKGLASVLISAFTPLAREKLEREMGRHTEDSEAVAQITTSLIDAAKMATGQPDPLQAVAQAQATPELIQQVEADALDRLQRLAPMLEQLASLDAAQHDRLEASRNAAELRARGAFKDQDEYLTRSIIRLLVGVLVGGAIMTSVLAYMNVDVQVILGALLALVGTIGGKFNSRYDHRYGSSDGSAAKDVAKDMMLSEIMRGRKTGA